MRISLALLTAATFACSPQSGNDTELLMDKVEEQVRLPVEAWPLQQYARHYALDHDGKEGAGRGKIVGVYLLPFPPLPTGPDVGCSKLVEQNGEFVAKDVPCPPRLKKSDEVAAGNRRWFNDLSAMPYILDGGCSMVTVIFDPSNEKVESTRCNGEA